MTREEFRQLVDSTTVILDGATGSNLRAAGMPVGVCSEKWISENPELITKLQSDYADAGSDIVIAPTFCANRYMLASYGYENELEKLNRELVAISRKAVGGRCLVAADMATLGKPVGEPDCPTYDELYDIYREQAELVADAGVDLFAIETMMGVTECTAAIEAIRSVCDLPIMCTLSLDTVGKAYFDGDAETAAQTLPAVGADAIGVNCGQGPDLLESVIRTLVANCDVPVIAKPNAGLPVMTPQGQAVYNMTPTRFARHMLTLKSAGARILGGCCGTTPEHIRALKEAVK